MAGFGQHRSKEGLTAQLERRFSDVGFFGAVADDYILFEGGIWGLGIFRKVRAAPPPQSARFWAFPRASRELQLCWTYGSDFGGESESIER